MLRHTSRILTGRLSSSRLISTASWLKTSDKPVVSEEKPLKAVNDVETMFRKRHAPNKLERKILVWTGKFKSESDIPMDLPIETIEMARNKARIKVANYMMLGTIIACFFFAFSGKRAVERGESVAQMNLDWHKKINADNKIAQQEQKK